MPFLLIALGLVITSLIFSVTVRTAVFNTLAAAGMFAQGVWRQIGGGVTRFFTAIPGYIATFFSVAWQVATASLLILIAIWIAWFVIWVVVGWLTNSIISGLIIGILLPLWSIMFIMVKIPVIRTAVRIPYYVAAVALLVAMVHIGVGIWSPNIKDGWNRLISNKKIEVANSLDKKSKQTEAESGIFATVIEDTPLLNENLQPFDKVKRGTIVMVTNLGKKKVADEDSEGLTRVMIPDRFGNFVKGNVGYIPSRLIDWKWKKEPAPPNVKETKYTPPLPPLPLVDYSQKPPVEKNWSGVYRISWLVSGKEYWIEPKIVFIGGNSFDTVYKYVDGRQQMRLAGTVNSSGTISGTYVQTLKGGEIISSGKFEFIPEKNKGSFCYSGGCLEAKVEKIS